MKKKENETTYNEALEYLRAENKAQKERITELEQQVELLTEAIRLAQRKRFGASSEHSSEEAMEQLSLPAKEDDSSVAVAAHKRHRRHEYTLDELPENVPVEVVEHRLPAEKLVCPECGSIMTEIGKDVRRRLKLVPAKAVVVED